MAVYVVSYDLNKQKNYPKLFEAIASAGTSFCHAQGSVWFIESSAGSVKLANYLRNAIDPDDTIFVGQVTGDSAWLLPATPSAWLKARL